MVYYTNTNTKTNKLIGTWKGPNNFGDHVTLSFKGNGDVIYFAEDGVTPNRAAKYILNTRKNPNWLDIK